jgi:cyclopropane fatty-acyl-phospholipid synthase-like methyltransferase
MTSKQFSTACERNRDPILAILRDLFLTPTRVLEIGSGTGQHAVYFGQQLPHVSWQTGDLPGNHPSIVAWQADAQLPNVLAPIVLDMDAPDWPSEAFDAVFSANTCHIMAWHHVERMFDGLPQVLGAGGLVCIYGPFNYGGEFTSASNAAFDASLRAQASHMGIRDIEAMNALAERNGLRLLADNAMPANNRLLVWQKA